MIKVFDNKLFIILSFVFVCATITGTLSHEFGHFIVAKALGYSASIHYGFTYHDDKGLSDSINTITSQYWKQLEEGVSFPDKVKYDQLTHKYFSNSFWISIGGPLQTLLTGTIGLLLLFVWKRSFKAKQKLRPGQWILIFITLFWLRPVANLAIWFGGFLMKGRFSHSGDEIRIAQYLHLPFWSLAIITGIIGAIIACTVIYKFIPPPQRLTFVLAGITGGILGYILWFVLLGPVLMP